MSLFGALFTGVSALNAQSQSLTVISNNIANANTTGYKRSEASFANLVTGFDDTSILQPGGVKAQASKTIDQQGLLNQTGASTDLGILGSGFFVVGQEGDQDVQYPLFTRAGQFREDESGNLKNTQGYLLYGWRLDANGDIPTDFDNISGLEPINLTFLPGYNQPTSDVSAAINLNASESADDLPADLSTFPIAAPATGFTTIASPDFTRVITVYDSLGEAQQLTLKAQKVMAPNLSTVQGVTTDLSTDDDIFDLFATTAAGDTISIDVTPTAPAGPTVSTAISIPAGATSFTIQDLLDQINGNVTGVTAFLDKDGQVVVQATDPTQTVTVSPPTAPTVDGGLGYVFAGNPVAYPAAGTVVAGATPFNGANTTGYPQFVNDPPTNPQGWWVFEFNAGGTIQKGYVNFNPDGTINAIPNAAGDKAVSLSNINWGNGASLQDIDFKLDNFSQLDSTYVTTFVEQNGSSFGVRSGIAIDTDGTVNVTFSNGRVLPIYKIPLADFPNVNGLNSQSLNVFTTSNDSGEVILNEANKNGSGSIFGSSLESSNVDLADEFSKMIITQRAYSAGTKLINTADQMLSELLNIR